jgi:hypothetical protein
LSEEKIIEAVVEEDEHFLGGKKIIYQNQDGTTCIVSINLVNIINDEFSGSTRD